MQHRRLQDVAWKLAPFALELTVILALCASTFWIRLQSHISVCLLFAALPLVFLPLRSLSPRVDAIATRVFGGPAHSAWVLLLVAGGAGSMLLWARAHLPSLDEPAPASADGVYECIVFADVVLLFGGATAAVWAFARAWGASMHALSRAARAALCVPSAVALGWTYYEFALDFPSHAAFLALAPLGLGMLYVAVADPRARPVAMLALASITVVGWSAAACNAFMADPHRYGDCYSGPPWTPVMRFSGSTLHRATLVADACSVVAVACVLAAFANARALTTSTASHRAMALGILSLVGALQLLVLHRGEVGPSLSRDVGDIALPHASTRQLEANSGDVVQRIDVAFDTPTARFRWLDPRAFGAFQRLVRPGEVDGRRDTIASNYLPNLELSSFTLSTHPYVRIDPQSFVQVAAPANMRVARLRELLDALGPVALRTGIALVVRVEVDREQPGLRTRGSRVHELRELRIHWGPRGPDSPAGPHDCLRAALEHGQPLRVRQAWRVPLDAGVFAVSVRDDATVQDLVDATMPANQAFIEQVVGPGERHRWSCPEAHMTRAEAASERRDRLRRRVLWFQ